MTRTRSKQELEQDAFPAVYERWTACGRWTRRGRGAFRGYNAEPIKESWILDVEGTRLLIETNWSPASPPEDVAEMRAIIDSIRIEP